MRGWTFAFAPAAGLGLFLVVAYGPLVGLVGAGVRSTEPMLAPERIDLLARSVALSLATAVTAMAVATLAATAWIGRTAGRLGPARYAALALAPIPPYVHALAWSGSAAYAGRSLEAGGLSMVRFDGWAAAWWVQTMALLPIAVGLAMVALDGVPGRLIEAGRVSRPDGGVLARVILPLAAPVLVAAAGMLFVLSLADYSVPTLFQVNVYALSVFAAYTRTADPGAALRVALPLVGLASLAVAAVQAGLRSAARPPDGPPRVPPTWPRAMLWFQWAAVTVVAASALLVVGRLVVEVGTVRTLWAQLAVARREIAFSLVVATLAALLVLPPAAALAPRLVARGRTARAWWLAVTLPIAIPAPLVGVGLIALWNRPGLPGIYGSAAMPVLAGMARFLPFAALVVAAQRRSLDPGLVDASRVLQAGSLHGLLAVRLPLAAPGLLAAAAVTFALTLGELGATLIVVPPGEQTLTLRIYSYLHYGSSDTVAGLCLAMAAASVAAGAIAAVALASWGRAARPVVEEVAS